MAAFHSRFFFPVLSASLAVAMLAAPSHARVMPFDPADRSRDFLSLQDRRPLVQPALDALNAGRLDEAASIAAALISMVWRIHRHRALPSDSGRRALYRIVPLLYTALVVAIFLLWLIGAMQLMWTVAIVALTLPVGKAVAALIDHLFDRAEEDARAEAAADTPPVGAEPSPEGGAAEPGTSPH